MKIEEWFDPYNIEHIKAYKHLMDTAKWPEGFIPEGMEFGSMWRMEIAYKMTDCWVSYKLAYQIAGYHIN